MTHYECKVCGHKCNTKEEMRRHIRTVHYKNNYNEIHFVVSDRGRWDYWFTDRGIIILKIAPMWMWWATFLVVLTIIAIFTGHFGGAVFGVIAGGIAGWIVDSLWAGKIRSRNKTMSIDEVIANSRNVLLAWSNISNIKLKKYIDIETIDGKKYRTNILVSKDLKVFLVSKLHNKVLE